MNQLLRNLAVLIIALMLLSACGKVQSKSSTEPGAKIDRNVVYGMYSGLALVMDVYYPEKPNGYGIVFISGSGWTRELSLDATPLTQTGQETIYAVPLQQAGYTVFNLNHRAAPRFRYPAPVEDVQRAVRFIRHNAGEFGIHAKHIGAMGGSSGAHLVSMLATMDGNGDPNDPSAVNRESAKVQCVVTRAAPMDLRENPEAPLFGFRGNAAKPGTVEKKMLIDASPITYVSADDPPFLLIHGDADPVVPYEWSVSMHKALNEAGVKAELMTVPGGGHGPRYESMTVIDGKRVRKEPDNPPDYIGAMLDWFDRYLREN